MDRIPQIPIEIEIEAAARRQGSCPSHSPPLSPRPQKRKTSPAAACQGNKILVKY